MQDKKLEHDNASCKVVVMVVEEKGVKKVSSQQQQNKTERYLHCVQCVSH